MNKKWMIGLTAAMCLTAATCTWAGIFDEYVDHQNDDGTYSYYFMQGASVTLDEEWYQNTIVKTDDSGATFYHKASWEAYEEEGMDGGRLFTIGASVNTDFKELPSFIYIGFDEDTAMNYYAELPSDYQGYAEDESIREAYDRLFAGVEKVVSGIEIGAGSVPSSDSQDSSDIHGGMLMGGWEATEDASITPQAQEAFDKAMEKLLGVDYEPVALLATQVVAGTNYCFLCRGTVVTPNARPSYKLVYVYADLSGGAQILDIQDLVFGISESDDGSVIPETDEAGE